MTKTAEKKTYRLASSEMVYAPGIIAWAINGYKFARDRPVILDVVLAWDFPREVAIALLSEKIPYTVEGNVVVVEAPNE